MKKYRLLIVAGLFLCACSSEKKKDDKLQTAITMKEYSNEFFSLSYPSNWEYEEEVNDMNEKIPAMSKGIRCTFYSSYPYGPWHTVMVQKSAMFECFKTPKEWRDASVQFKQFDNQYIATVDSYMQDSINFGPYPAAMAGFVVALESGDTVIHKQTVIMNGSDLYYLNNTFDWNDDGTLETKGDSILASFRILSSKNSEK